MVTKIGNIAKQRLWGYVRGRAAEYVNSYRTFVDLLAEAFRNSSIAESPKLLLAWIAGIAAAIAVVAVGVLLFDWIGVREHGSDFVSASSGGLMVLAITAGVRTGRRVASALVKPLTDSFSLATTLNEKAMLRAIFGGAFLFTLLTIPLDLLSLPGTTWPAALAYVVWVMVALALATLWGRLVSFHTKRIAGRAR